MADDWRAVAKKVRNWGNWGADDQLGTLNYITPQKIAHASTLAKQGKVFPLSIPIEAMVLPTSLGLISNLERSAQWPRPAYAE